MTGDFVSPQRAMERGSHSRAPLRVAAKQASKEVESMSPEAVGPDRLPPQNLDAERSVLGSMLRDNDVIDVVTQIVNAESFYLDAHRKIYQAMIDLRSKGGQPVDLVILHEELSKRGQLEDV